MTTESVFHPNFKEGLESVWGGGGPLQLFVLLQLVDMCAFQLFVFTREVLVWDLVSLSC